MDPIENYYYLPPQDVLFARLNTNFDDIVARYAKKPKPRMRPMSRSPNASPIPPQRAITPTFSTRSPISSTRRLVAPDRNYVRKYIPRPKSAAKKLIATSMPSKTRPNKSFML